MKPRLDSKGRCPTKEELFACYHVDYRINSKETRIDPGIKDCQTLAALGRMNLDP